MTFIAGTFAVTRGSDSLGIIEDALRLEITNSTQPIVGDNMGDSVQDGVYRGGNCYVDMILQEFDAAGAVHAFAGYHLPSGGVREFGAVGMAGRLMTGVDTDLVLTAIAGSTARLETLGYVYTFANTVLAPNFPLQMLFGARLRNVPIRFQCLPYNGGTPTIDRWFEITAPP